MKTYLCLSALLLTSITVNGIAQTLPQTLPLSLQQTPQQQAQQQAQDEAVDQYMPLFTPEQMAKASEGSRKRMQATEKMNRDAWIKRRQRRAEAKAEKEAASRAPAQPPAPKYTRKGKIYKWVDDQGRVHFGDAPTGENSQQIKLRNTQPAIGGPPPATAPHLKASGEDS